MSAKGRTQSQTILCVEDLTVRIDRAPRSFLVVQNVSFSIQRAKTLALVGESGSGKTMTALALLGLLPKGAKQTGGRITFAQSTVGDRGAASFERLRGRHIAMIFQEASAALNPVLPVGIQIADVIKTHLGLPSKIAKARVLELFTAVGFTDSNMIYRAFPHELSGGMSQRAMIAMALSCEPQLIIADEPTTALDVTIQNHILYLIKQLQIRHQFALLLISHDIGIVKALADSIIVMKAGKVIETGDTKELLTHPHHPYTQSLINSIFLLPKDKGEPVVQCQAPTSF